MNQQEQIAYDLLKIGAVQLDTDKGFTWASGIQSPIYCDNRVTLSYPAIRKHIIQAMKEYIEMYYPDVQCIAGTATAGIPHAALLAEALNLPMIYIRNKPKDHGRCSQIEGTFLPGTKMIVIDDLISTGGSVLNAVKVAQNEGANVCAVLSIFSYQLPKATENFAKVGIPYHSMTNYQALIQIAAKEHYIEEKDLSFLEEWRKEQQ